MKKTVITCSLVLLGLIALVVVAQVVDLPAFIMRLHGR